MRSPEQDLSIKNNEPGPVPSISVRGSGLVVRLADCEAEINAAQRLRYRIFYEELKATASPEIAEHKMDWDQFDPVADHLLVIDESESDPARRVVGTYRLLRREAKQRCGSFYSAGEFDLALLDSWPGEILELGRSCVEAGYRDRRVINLLWQGIAHYIVEHNIEIMFGCGSLPGTDVERLKLPLAYLHHHHLAPRNIRARAVAERYVDMARMPRESVDRRRALSEIPPLIKGYLRLGAFVGDGAVIDHDFNCTDVCIIVKTDRVNGKYARHYHFDEV